MIAKNFEKRTKAFALNQIDLVQSALGSQGVMIDIPQSTFRNPK
jgi:hypothetical protein